MTFEFARFRLQLCFSFFALFSLMLLFGSGTVALLCFFSSLLHESGHLFFLTLFHVDVRLISFSAGGILIERRDGGSCSSYFRLRFYRSTACVSVCRPRPLRTTTPARRSPVFRAFFPLFPARGRRLSMQARYTRGLCQWARAACSTCPTQPSPI